MKYPHSALIGAVLLLLLAGADCLLPARADLADSLKAMAAGTQPPITNPNPGPRPVNPLAVYLYYGDADVPVLRTVIYDNGLVVTIDPLPIRRLSRMWRLIRTRRTC